MDTPPKPCDRPVCYGRSHLFGPIRGQTDHSDMGWPMQSRHYDPPKRPIFDQFGPPWPESRLLRAKTGDSGLENKHIPTLDRKMD